MPLHPQNRSYAPSTSHSNCTVSSHFPTRRSREEDEEGGVSKRIKLDEEERVDPVFSPSSPSYGTSLWFDGRHPERPNSLLNPDPSRFHLPSSRPSLLFPNGNQGLEHQHHQSTHTPSPASLDRRSLSPLEKLSPFSSSSSEAGGVSDLVQAQPSPLRSQLEHRLAADLEKERTLRIQAEQTLEEERKQWKQNHSSMRARLEQLEGELKDAYKGMKRGSRSGRKKKERAEAEDGREEPSTSSKDEVALEKHQQQLDRVRAESLPLPPPPPSSLAAGPSMTPWRSKDTPPHHHINLPPPDFQPGLSFAMPSLPKRTSIRPSLVAARSPFFPQHVLSVEPSPSPNVDTSPPAPTSVASNVVLSSNRPRRSSVASSSNPASSSFSPQTPSDPVQLLLTLHPRSRFFSLLESRTDGAAWTSIVLDVEGVEKFSGVGKTVEEAKRDAAMQALEDLSRGG